MKKLFSFFLTCVLIPLNLMSCGADSDPIHLPEMPTYTDPSGYVVDGVMEYPDYSFDGEPTTDELRQKAVEAFQDVLSVRWSLSEEITYNKTGPVSDKTFHHDADVTYAGVIYSNANTGLFQFLEYYDFETGRIHYPGGVEEFKESLGASCADAMIWGVNTVCNSLTGSYYPACMVYQNGYLPVGNYTYDQDVTNLILYPTYKIVKENGEDVIIDAYTKVLPGDMFTSTPDNHGMMVISEPVVMYADDGSVDLDNSYVMIQDQRGGQGAGFYEVTEDDQIIRYSGRTSAKFTFRQLLDKSYLPVTTAEFAGTKEYEAPTASISKKCRTINQLRKATVQSNYPLAVVNVWAADQFGQEYVIGRQLFGGGGEKGAAREFSLGELECLQSFENSPYYHRSITIKVEVVTSTGERFIVAQVSGK